MTQTLLFRADAGDTGAGHVMRCLAIAEAAADQGLSCRFAMQTCPRGLRDRLSGAGFAIDILDEDDGPNSFLALIDNIAPAAVIIDGYTFDENYRAAVAATGPCVLAMDDLVGGQLFHADLIANANPAAGPADYKERAGEARLLLGLSYAPLRREFVEAVQASSAPLAERNRLLVTFGGSDPLRLSHPLTALLLDALPDAVSIDLVLGSDHPGQDDCETLRDQNPQRIALHIDTRDMAALMRAAGLAISAAGSTAMELARMAVPAILVATADNQEAVMDAHSALGWCRGLDARAAMLQIASKIADSASALWGDLPLRQVMAEKAGNLVDGKGAARIVAALLETINPER